MNYLSFTPIFRKKLTAIALSAFLTAFTPNMVMADALDDAKAAGQVGEKLDGYLAVLQKTPAIQALVKDINQKREAAWKEIATKRALPITEVQKVFAEEVFERSKSGTMLQQINGDWKKK